jgi:hypothetical protein
MIVIYEERGQYSDHSITIRGTAASKELAPAACRYFAARAADRSDAHWREFRESDESRYQGTPAGSCVVLEHCNHDDEDWQDARASLYDTLVTWQEVEHLDLPEDKP